MGSSIDIDGLSAEEKRTLLSRLLMEQAEAEATTHPMSYGQRSLWFLHNLAPGSAAYTITYAGAISGQLDVSALTRAAQAVVDRHPILRTTYAVRDGQPVQIVHPKWPLRIAQHDLGGNPADFDEWLRQEANRPFDLQTGPVLRVSLLRRAPDDHVLVLAVHHIAVDFWSIDIILDELRVLYAAEQGAAEAPPACRARYVDHTDRQLAMLDGERGDELWRYWSRQLAGEVPVTRLPVDRPRPPTPTYRGAVHRFTIDRRLGTAIKEVGRQVGATPYMTLLAAFATLLHRYSGQEDLFIGSPFACREGATLEGLVGYVANAVVLRTDLRSDPRFCTLLGRVKETVLGALAHQDYPFALLVERLRPPRHLSHTPLFQVSFVWEQARRFQDALRARPGALPRGTLQLDTIHIGQGGAPLDLMMQVADDDGQLSCVWQYSTDLFDDSTIERMAGHFETLLAGIVSDPDCRVSQLPVLSEAENRQQAAWNDTRVRYDSPACLDEMVAASVRRSPGAVAVSFEDRELTYAELDRQAGALADRLRHLGVGPDTVVPVLLDRSDALVVALLGVLKAGGAFMPLDPAQPVHRITAMLSDVSDSPVSVTHRCHLDRVPGLPGHHVCLDDPPTPAATSPDIGARRSSADLAYVTSTSGSTGAPKAALNSHAGIVNRLLWMQQNYQLTADDSVLHKTPITFDASVWEIFWPLIAGARLVVAKPEGHKDVAYLARTIAEKSITTVHFVPSMLRSFLAQPQAKACTALRRVLCAGEALPYELAQRFLATLDAELWNEYGPAEAAIGVTYFPCRAGAFGSPVPIGRPIANIRTHVLDTHLQPLPVGVAGELFIGGIGVGRGYLNRPDATAAAFIPDPFSDEPNCHLYRTGDLVRYRPDGNIEYLGRIDDQVKIGGVRIEPREVEAALEQYPGIRETAVVADQDDRGNTRLVAYVVGVDDSVATVAALRRFMLERLPAAMVPAVFCVTDTMPRTSSGKVDRRALTTAGGAPPIQPRAFIAPRTRVEKMIADIWCEVLEVDRVGVLNDFFALGGTSTQSVEVATRAQQLGLPMTPEAIFLHGTVAELAGEYSQGAEESVHNGSVPNHAKTPQDNAIWPPKDQMAQPFRSRVHNGTQPVGNTVIESLGAYLPAETMSTESVLAGCANDIGIPLERLTGIKRRRVAGHGEYSIDLAAHAAVDCLARSSYGPEEIDLVISCNISRCDGPNRKIVFEPSTATRLRDRCGLTNALAFDLTNACAGMFTGILVADAFLKTGVARSVMVVSGEYITHVTETAQKEIEGAMDPRLACLTLGDAGAAVILERGPNDSVGFHDIDMATLSRYSDLCVAKATDRPHGGAIMFCDSIAGTAVAVKRSLPYVAAVMQRHRWRPEHCDHIVMHQTSEASINDAVTAVNRLFGPAAASARNVIYNLAERGNTATTTHFIALSDHIMDNRIRSGDKVVFSITGSGQTVGAALYTFDDLPDRIRRTRNGQPVRRARRSRRGKESAVSPRVHIEGFGTAPALDSACRRTAVQLAAQAAKACLDRTGLDPDALGLIIHAGVYRDEFLCEPAVAALVAGELGINDDVESPDVPKTLAFDVVNGAVGFLNACHVAAQMIGTEYADHAMVVASEIENNFPENGHAMYGLHETGSAMILGRSAGQTGFGRFVFHHRPEFVEALETYMWNDDGHTCLRIDRDPGLAAHYVDAIPSAVEELLELEGLHASDIAVVIPPYSSLRQSADLSTRIGIPTSRFVDLPFGADLFTSSVVYGLQHASGQQRLRGGDIGLIISVGSGIEVGCATYRF